VSPLWRDHLSLAIAPDRIVLVRARGGLRPQAVAKTIVAVAPTNTGGWAPALQTLSQVLSDRQWQGVDVSAVLANDFARYQLIPWSDEIASEEERENYIRQSFKQVYGDGVADWVYAVSENSRGAAWFVAAMELALVQQLEEIIGQAQSKLMSIMPHVMPAFNNARRVIKGRDLWFVQVEKQQLLLALILDGRWQTISLRHVSEADWQTELPLLLDREWRLKGLDQVPRTVAISAPEARQSALNGAGKWEFHWLRPALRYGFSGRTDAPYAMALGA
jgi:hypothetical protein